MTGPARSVCVHYLGRSWTHEEVERQSSAFAQYLRAHGVQRGDRILLQLQNMPQALVACQAAWRLGAVVVPANPMYKAAELSHLITDCRPKAAVVLDNLYDSTLRPLGDQLDGVTVVSTSPGDFADPAVAAELGLEPVPVPGVPDFAGIVAASVAGDMFDREALPPTDIAALVYTSGTTGPPKGAVITHGNLTVETAVWDEAYGLRPGDTIMGVAPFFHITGLVADLVFALARKIPIVYMHRFDPHWALRWIELYRPTVMVAAITVYTALLRQPGLTAERVSSLRACLSGGAPVSSATVRWWQDVTGGYLRNCYGLTETSSLATIAPAGSRAPEDQATGALSVGKAVGDTTITIHDADDQAAPANEVGEIVIGGGQVAAGYWGKPAETAETFRAGGLRTGDVGFLDEDGWLYVIDRRKDLIVTSGYKVWPREVEDLLLRHPAVLEASVVGAADAYRGERVVAYVALRPGEDSQEADLISFCRDRVAVYKAPREVHVVRELPKSPAGKILRRELREAHRRATENPVTAKPGP